jgi:hypothetical protein
LEEGPKLQCLWNRKPTLREEGFEGLYSREGNIMCIGYPDENENGTNLGSSYLVGEREFMFFTFCEGECP